MQDLIDQLELALRRLDYAEQARDPHAFCSLRQALRAALQRAEEIERWETSPTTRKPALSR